MSAFMELMESTGDDLWRAPTDGDWTFADHVGHLAAWFVEGAKAVEAHRAGRAWADLPPEGVDAFNARQVLASVDSTPAELRQRFADGLARLRAATAAMTDAEWLDPEGFSWAYEDLHGHVRAHHAMVGPWVARSGWAPRADAAAATD
jgi:hypothetical protein